MIKQKTIIVPVIILTLLVVGGLAFAQYQTAKVVNVAGDYIEAPLPYIEEELGAISSPDIMSRWIRHNGLMTFIENGSFIDASTTLVSFINPFNTAPTSTDARYNSSKHFTATTTVDLIAFNITTAATSTMQVLCGASADAWGSVDYEFAVFLIPTSTLGTMENNLATTTGGFAVVGGGVTSKILLTHDYPWFVCYATGTPESIIEWGPNEARQTLISDGNAFDGRFMSRIYKSQ